MNYLDNKRAQTAEELRRIYNLDKLDKDRRAIENNKAGLTRVESEQSSILKSLIINLGSTLESQGEIALWFFDGIPTLENIPSSEWENLEEHIGDLYYDKETGYVYKFIYENDTYNWNRQVDSSLIQAMALTNAELDTIDGTRKVFFDVPIPPYDNGDWYIDTNGDLYICQISKPSTELYDSNDFIIASKYTDDTKANELAGKLTIVSGQITTIIQGLDLISQTIEDNRYYVDETGKKHLIAQSMSQLIQRVDLIQQTISVEKSLILEDSGTNQVFIEDALKYYPLELKITGYSNTRNLLYPGTFYPGVGIAPIAYQEPSMKSILLCIDSADRNHPTADIKKYPIAIGEPLRSLDDIKDELTISMNDDGNMTVVITRRLKYTGSQIVKLDKPIIKEFTFFEIELLENKNYIYIYEQLNYQVYVKYLLNSEMNSFFVPRVEAKSMIKQAEDKIELNVSQKFVSNSTFNSTVAELNGSITTTATNINLEVSKKVGKDEIIASINLSSEEATINANKIGLKANDILNLIAGNEINLTSRNISISSNNFSVNKYGDMSCRNATLSGTFANYDSTGKLAIKISSTIMEFYDWKGTGQIVGGISSIVNNNNPNEKGIELYTYKGKSLFFGYKEDPTASFIDSLMHFDTNNPNSTPWIINTANGRLFSDGNKGIEIENGLVKTWDMSHAKSCSVAFPFGEKTLNMTFEYGLLTDLSIT